jgi:hypothetical protein
MQRRNPKRASNTIVCCRICIKELRSRSCNHHQTILSVLTCQLGKSINPLLHALQHGATVQSTFCDCKPGWTGVGCEVKVPTLPLNVPTTIVPIYNADMKLTWSSSLNLPWSLMHLQVHTRNHQRAMYVDM